MEIITCRNVSRLDAVMANIPLRIAVDFDGVLHDPLNVKPGYKMGIPIKGAV